MKLGLNMKTSLSQTLTPQQIQYLKLLQMPTLQIEQQIRQELEQNPMLESAEDGFDEYDDDFVSTDNEIKPAEKDDKFDSEYSESEPRSLIDEDGDPFEFYKMIWQDEVDKSSDSKNLDAMGDDSEGFQIKATLSFAEEMMEQLSLFHLSELDMLIANEIVWSVDSDGYLRRELSDIVEKINEIIQNKAYDALEPDEDEDEFEFDNPARMYALDAEPKSKIDKEELLKNINYVNIEQAERVLKIIQSLDPAGIASRNIQECLLAQLNAIEKPNAAQKLALEVISKTYEAFAMKHYQQIAKVLDVTEDYLREAIEVIRKLNPKPGGGTYQTSTQTIIPDFIVDRDEDDKELTVTLNDSRTPIIKVSKAYERIKKDAKYKQFNKDTKEWLRTKFEDAKFLIQAIKQRKNTMLKVMTAIAALQSEFFEYGPNYLKPLIYKDVSENTGLDISTVCRIVGGKYVETKFGSFELKYFFSESLSNDDGEEVSTTVIKQTIKDMIDSEPKNKPYSDDKLSDILKERGYNVARRTVAKYREQMRLPVARLRREL